MQCFEIGQTNGQKSFVRIAHLYDALLSIDSKMCQIRTFIFPNSTETDEVGNESIALNQNT